ncbi:MAG TPA: hypothetical protein VJG90_01830 [Candidatus Nanoarchaeia archaeon]|nr:hypothetical protein [Candidatus Nanoarchaeia archaeon]
MRAYILILMMVLGAISVSAAYDLVQTGYWIPSYYKTYQGQGTESLKTIGVSNSYTSKADFRKSTFRPITRVITGPSLAWNRQVQVLADTGSGLYVPYDTYSSDMVLKNMDMRARGGPSPYVGIYGVERQAIQTYNVAPRNFGIGTGSGYLNPGIPNMIRGSPQYVSAGLPAYVDEGSATSAQ